MSESEQIKPWYKQGWGILLTIVLFPIVVPYLVWTQTDWNKNIKIGITVACGFVVLLTVIGNQQTKKEAQELVTQAETYISEGKITEAKEAISKSMELNSDEEQNGAFALEEKIAKISSEDFIKETLVKISDSDFNLLQKGELKTQFIDHKKLNSIFINTLAENADKRAGYIAEIKEQERLAKEEAEKKKKEEEKKQRTEMIEKQFSAWDGAHRGLEEVIKESMNDPDSYEHVETVYWDMKDHLVVRTTFRGTNAFGGTVKNFVKAKVSLDGEVLEIIEQY